MDRDESATTPDGSMPDLEDGDQHHDELANTDPDNHGAVTSAPVMGEVPQGIGWSEPGAEATDAQAQPKGEGDSDLAPAREPKRLDDASQAEQPAQAEQHEQHEQQPEKPKRTSKRASSKR